MLFALSLSLKQKVENPVFKISLVLSTEATIEGVIYIYYHRSGTIYICHFIFILIVMHIICLRRYAICNIQISFY